MRTLAPTRRNLLSAVAAIAVYPSVLTTAPQGGEGGFSDDAGTTAFIDDASAAFFVDEAGTVG
jgi:hypothetical protein